MIDCALKSYRLRPELDIASQGSLVEEARANLAEASLVNIFRRFPPHTATEISALAERLAELAPNERIDWSDSWSDDDLIEFRAASLRRLAAEESEDRS